MLTKEQLLQATIEKEKVDLLGDHAYVRGMTGTERDQWEQWCLFKRKNSKTETVENFRASLVVRTVCDEGGVRLFTDTDLAAVGGMPGALLDKLYEIGARLSGVSNDDAEKLGKNSESDQSDGSTSA